MCFKSNDCLFIDNTYFLSVNILSELEKYYQNAGLKIYFFIMYVISSVKDKIEIF